MHIFFKVGFIKSNEAGISNFVPFKNPEIAGIGKINGPGFQREGQVISRIIPVGVLYEKETEVIGAETGDLTGRSVSRSFRLWMVKVAFELINSTGSPSFL